MVCEPATAFVNESVPCPELVIVPNEVPPAEIWNARLG